MQLTIGQEVFFVKSIEELAHPRQYDWNAGLIISRLKRKLRHLAICHVNFVSIWSKLRVARNWYPFSSETSAGSWRLWKTLPFPSQNGLGTKVFKKEPHVSSGMRAFGTCWQKSAPNSNQDGLREVNPYATSGLEAHRKSRAETSSEFIDWTRKNPEPSWPQKKITNPFQSSNFSARGFMVFDVSFQTRVRSFWATCKRVPSFSQTKRVRSFTEARKGWRKFWFSLNRLLKTQILLKRLRCRNKSQKDRKTVGGVTNSY